ncbi:MAG TPA: hypothetical protein VIL92_12850 [Gaiellaceae bacterium]
MGGIPCWLFPPPFGHRWEQVEETSLRPLGDDGTPGRLKDSITVWRCKRCGKETWR